MPAFRGRLDLARPAERLADGIAVDRECPGQPPGLIESRYLSRERARALVEQGPADQLVLHLHAHIEMESLSTKMVLKDRVSLAARGGQLL